MTTETILTTLPPTSTFKAIKPNQVINVEARKRYTEAYNKALDAGSIPRDKLQDYLVKKGIIDQSDIKKIEEMQAKIAQLLEPLNKGGIKLKEMVERAKEASNVRASLYEARQNISKYDYMTAESVAEDAKIMYYIWACFRNQDGTHVWKTFEDFQNSTDSDLQTEAARAVDEVLYPDSDFDIIKVFAGLPENEFLIKQKIYDEKLQEVSPDTKPAVFLDDEGNPLETTD
jgi:hypothetical protein